MMNPFYVRVADAQGNTSVTGLQITLPPGLTREQARDFVFRRIVTEMDRYMIPEMLAGLGNAANYQFRDPAHDHG